MKSISNLYSIYSFLLFIVFISCNKKEDSIEYKIEISTPSVNEQYQAGTNLYISWVTNFSEPVSIDLYKDNAFLTNICASCSNANYSWQIPEDFTAGVNYMIKLSCPSNGAFAQSGTFEITAPSSITILTPTYDDVWIAGTQQIIKWNTNIDQSFIIELLKNNSFERAISLSASGGEYSWDIPGILEVSSDYQIKISGNPPYNHISSTSAKFEISQGQSGRKKYVGKWLVVNDKNVLPVQKKMNKAPDNPNLKNILGMPNIAPYKPDNWTDKIILKSAPVNDGETMQDDIISDGNNFFVALSFINEGDESLTQPFNYKIYIDDVMVHEFRFEEILDIYYYWMYWNIQIQNLNLSAGQHTIKAVYDADNEISESNENDNEYSRTFNVSGSGSGGEYNSFEFVNNRYLIINSDGSEEYGKLSSNATEDQLYLENFGTISISSISDNDIFFTVNNKNYKKSEIHATRVADVSPETDMTKLLIGAWEIETSDHPNQLPGTNWVYMPSGRYMFEFEDGDYFKKWGYISETEFEYGPLDGPMTGRAYIREIRDDYMKIEDTAGYFYHFKKNND